MGSLEINKGRGEVLLRLLAREALELKASGQKDGLIKDMMRDVAAAAFDVQYTATPRLRAVGGKR